MYKYTEIEVVHLEMTEACNASCPMCARNLNGGEVNPYIHNRELYIDDIKRMFPIEFVKQLKRIYMCGNYGDPISARDTLEAFKYFRDTIQICFSLCTPTVVQRNRNGGQNWGR